MEGAVAGKEGETTAFSVPRVFRRSFYEYSREYEARLLPPKSKRSKRDTRKRKSSSSSPASFHPSSVDLKTFFPRLWNNQEARFLGNCLVPGRLCESPEFDCRYDLEFLKGGVMQCLYFHRTAGDLSM